jgi:hypothetical protein
MIDGFIESLRQRGMAHMGFSTAPRRRKDTVEPIARCDLRRVAAFSAEVAEQEDGELSVRW